MAFEINTTKTFLVVTLSDYFSITLRANIIKLLY
jgi:hypothetical protein